MLYDYQNIFTRGTVHLSNYVIRLSRTRQEMIFRIEMLNRLWLQAGRRGFAASIAEARRRGEVRE